MGFALAFGIPTIIAIAAYIIKPEWRGRRLFGRWLLVVIVTSLTFYLVDVFVRPAGGR